MPRFFDSSSMARVLLQIIATVELYKETKVKKLLLLTGFSVFYLVGCVGEPQQKSAGAPVGQSSFAVMDANGFDPNGLDPNGFDSNGMDSNGLDPNGLDPNGLDTNGLDPNGLDSNGLAQFSKWFTTFLWNPAGTYSSGYSDMVMKYVAKCAVASGDSLTVTLPNVSYTSPWDPATCYPTPSTSSATDSFATTSTSSSTASTTCSWPGALGLAPVWRSGHAIPVNEQELMTACLAGHINARGEHGVVVSFYGGGLLVTADEFFNYYVGEAYFFGNIFNGSPIYMVRKAAWTPRGCAAPGACSPMVFAPGGTQCGGNPGQIPSGSCTTPPCPSTASCTIPNDPHGPWTNAISTSVVAPYASQYNPIGSLELMISGLPAGVNAPIGLTGAGSYSYLISSSNPHAFKTINLGSYNVTASNVTVGSYTYRPIYPTQQVTLNAYTYAGLTFQYK
jgi:hypothetical protein